jgi:hypothetical protein
MHQHSHQYGSRWPNASVRTGVDALTNVPESLRDFIQNQWLQQRGGR